MWTYLTVCVSFLATVLAHQQFLGDACTHFKTRRLGTCVRVSDCSTAINSLDMGSHPQICSYAGHMPIVCCPNPMVTADRVPAETPNPLGVPHVFSEITDHHHHESTESVALSQKPKPLKPVLKPVTDKFIPSVWPPTKAPSRPAPVPTEAPSPVEEETEAAPVDTWSPSPAPSSTEDDMVRPVSEDEEEVTQRIVQITSPVSIPRPIFDSSTPATVLNIKPAVEIVDETSPENSATSVEETASPETSTQMNELGPEKIDIPIANQDASFVSSDKSACSVTRRKRSGIFNEEGVTEKKCQEYSRMYSAPKDCAVSNESSPTVAAGREAKLLEFPHIAQIGYGSRDNILFGCAGSLISPDFVLTSAHCLFSNRSPARWVRLGAINSDSEANEQIIQVVSRIRYPGYSSSNRYNDIALLRLKNTPDMSTGIRPACLHTDRNIRDTGLNIFAWSASDKGNKQNKTLRTVTVFKSDPSVCREEYSQNSVLPEGINFDSQLCAANSYIAEANPSATPALCLGDYGAPLQYSDDSCTHHIIGVTSLSKSCGFVSPDVYTRVSAYIPWVEKIVWPSEASQSSKK